MKAVIKNLIDFRQIKNIDRELQELNTSERLLVEKLELRKKQFHALLTSIHQLREILKGKNLNSSEKMYLFNVFFIFLRETPVLSSFI